MFLIMEIKTANIAQKEANIQNVELVLEMQVTSKENKLRYVRHCI